MYFEGPHKPFFDIWSNVVNVASRMESCGIMGKIQCTENTANVLMTAGYACECRGPIFVKGNTFKFELAEITIY